MVPGRLEGSMEQKLERLLCQGSLTGLTEGQLLDRFATARDEAAFEALVDLHGPMVLGVCRQFLRDPNDVDDAFQATFLVLVRKAGSLRQKDLLGNWLYGVACRVALRARSLRYRNPTRTAASMAWWKSSRRRPVPRSGAGVGGCLACRRASLAARGGKSAAREVPDPDRALLLRGSDPRRGGSPAGLADRHGQGSALAGP